MAKDSKYCAIYGDYRLKSNGGTVTVQVNDTEQVLEVCDYHLDFFAVTDPTTYEIAWNFIGEPEVRLLSAIPADGGAPPWQGDPGLSAYDVAVVNGFVGTEEEWLNSLKGEDGDIGLSAYEIAVVNGFVGTEEEWLLSLTGPAGPSAYEVAVTNGFVGTEEEWLLSLEGTDGEDGAQGPAGVAGYAYQLDNLDNWSEDLGFDYEFNAGTFADPVVALPDGWSWVNQGGSSYSESLGAGAVLVPGNAGENLRTIARSLAGAPAAWSLYGKMESNIDELPQYAEVGIVFRESGTNKAIQFGYYQGGSGASVAVVRWDNNTAASFPALQNPWRGSIKYWRIRKNSATSYDFHVSVDGKQWRQILAGYNPSFTPDQIGFAINRNHANPLEASIQWLRLR
jgi:hypothetical protein